MKRHHTLIWVAALLGFACTSANPMATIPVLLPTETSSAPTTSDLSTPAIMLEPTHASGLPDPTTVLPVAPLTQALSGIDTLPTATLIDFPEAESISVAANAQATYALFGFGNNLFLSQAANQSTRFSQPVQVSLGAPVQVVPVERPALALGPDNQIGVAWIHYTANQKNQIWQARSTDGGQTFEPGTLQYDTSALETAMVGETFDSQIRPNFYWLENGQLMWLKWLADDGQTGTVFPIDDLVCECCQPQAVRVGANIYIAYRNVEHDPSGQDIRDIFLLRSSNDGLTFTEPVRVADEHWFLNACPVAGPALYADETLVYVAWMDARNDVAGTLSQSDIWFAVSRDGGQTFTPDLRVSADNGYFNTLPVLAVGPGGRIHLVWETHSDTADFLAYTTSDDQGNSFATPRIIVSSEQAPERGRVGKPALTISPTGQISLAWIDGLGVRLAIWNDTQ